MSRKRRSAGAAAFLAIAAASLTLDTARGATTFYVNANHPACTNSGNGTSSKPFCAIAPAASRAAAGDTVEVAAGTYSEQVRPSNSGTAAAPITFRGSGAIVRGGTRGFVLSGRSWIVVEGFEVTATDDHGIYASGSCSRLTIRGNHVHHVGKPIDGLTARGIYLKTCTDSTIVDNDIDHATDFGIGIASGSSRIVVTGNRTSMNARGYARAAAGISVRDSTDITVENNVSWENEDSGINIWDSTGSIVRNNVTYFNGDHGIDNLRATGTKIVANTVFDNVDSGIEVVGAAAGVAVANNISVDNGIDSPRTTANLRVDATAAANVQANFDLLWLSQPGDMVDWAGSKYSTLAAFVSATGQEQQGVSADPRFAGPTDFHLTPGSPAVDSADSGAPSHPAADIAGAARVDDPATDDTGVGPRSFDDRGAYEMPPATAPAAVDDVATVVEDAVATAIDVLANDANPSGVPLSIASATDPANGVVVASSGTSLTYQPDAGYCNDGGSPDTFQYTLLPGGSTATVSVSVTCQGPADPVAADDVATVAEDSGATAIDVLANDTDPEAAGMTVASATDPANGAAAVTGGGIGVTYEPDANFCGDDAFDYSLAPGGSVATVSVTVTCAPDDPVAVEDSATVAQDSATTTIDVLSNDLDPDPVGMTVDAATQPANGTVVVTNGGADLTYQPNTGYCNDTGPTDDFTYTLAPGGSTATVSVRVTCPLPADPVAADDAATVAEDSDATAIDVLANDSDPDGVGMTVASATDPANGTVVVTGGGTGLTYEPDPNFCSSGTDGFTYVLAPGGSTATVTVTVTCVDDDPVAADDSATVQHDSATTTIDVLANDVDPDGGPISIASATQPANGTVVVTDGGADLTYQPNPGYCDDEGPTDDFTYTLEPGGSTATVAVRVTCPPPADPVATDDDATVAEDSGATAIDVLANDSDPDGVGMTIASATDPANGSVAITGGGAGLTYAPDANVCGVSDTFDYTLAPGGSTATVTVTVSCVDDDPTAVNDSATVSQGSSATTIDVLANDTDPDGGPITIFVATQPTNGTVVVTNGGADLTYQPSAGYCNTNGPTDDFTYTLAPGGSIGVVSVRVRCPDELIFSPSGDATIREAKPTSTNGSGTTIATDVNPNKDSLIKFNVTGVGGRTIVGARLVLHNLDPSDKGGGLHRMTDGTWNESFVTWRNAPWFDPTPFTLIGPVALGTTYSIDVRAVVTGDGTVSMRLKNTSTDDAGYASKEHGTASIRPKLIVQVQ